MHISAAKQEYGESRSVQLKLDDTVQMVCRDEMTSGKSFEAYRPEGNKSSGVKKTSGGTSSISLFIFLSHFFSGNKKQG